MINKIQRGRKSTPYPRLAKVNCRHTNRKGGRDTEEKRTDSSLKGQATRAEGQNEHGGQVCQEEHGQLGGAGQEEV